MKEADWRDNWHDPNVWASWLNCGWQPDESHAWVCLLPKGHSGPHIAPLHMEADPCDTEWVSKDGNWADPPPCPVPGCGHSHPGFRHATRNDPHIITYHHQEDAWGPSSNYAFPDGPDLLLNDFVPTFVDKEFPTPPKFRTIEEAEAWLEANPP